MTDEGKNSSFKLNINVGCFDETEIYVKEGLTPYSQDYFRVIVLQKADENDVDTWIHEEDVYADWFGTDVSDCVAY